MSNNTYKAYVVNDRRNDTVDKVSRGATVTAEVVGKTAVVAAAATAYVTVSALATYGWSKLGERIWDAL